MRRATQLLAVMCVVAFVFTLFGCGGSGGPNGPTVNTAGKPEKPPPNPPPEGMIYFVHGGVFSTMGPDGSNKTPVGGTYSPQRGEPSHQLHAGTHWFLEVQEVSGGGTYPAPDMYSREIPVVELVAVRADGSQVVSLHSDPYLEPLLPYGLEDHPYYDTDYVVPRWTKDDARVSWKARRWAVDPASGELVVAETGLYVATVAYTGDAPSGLADLPQRANVEFQVTDTPPYGTWNFGRYDWSPDGMHIACRLADALWVANTETGATTWLATSAVMGPNPRWSSDGGKITFVDWGISTIDPDGSNLTQLIANRTEGKRSKTYYSKPEWSPTGEHIAFWRRVLPNDYRQFDIFVIPRDGGSATNITKDTDEWCIPWAWR